MAVLCSGYASGLDGEGTGAERMIWWWGGQASCCWAALVLLYFKDLPLHDGEIFSLFLVVVWCCVMTIDGRLLQICAISTSRSIKICNNCSFPLS
jgi:hypothetical protein